jgi:hypothetical protein
MQLGGTTQDENFSQRPPNASPRWGEGNLLSFAAAAFSGE